MPAEALSSSLPETSSATSARTEKNAEETLEQILSETSRKLRAAAPRLIGKYQSEAANHPGDMNTLYRILYSKAAKRTLIFNEGSQKLSNIRYSSAAGSDSEYQNSFNLLKRVYNEEVTKLSKTCISQFYNTAVGFCISPVKRNGKRGISYDRIKTPMGVLLCPKMYVLTGEYNSIFTKELTSKQTDSVGKTKYVCPLNLN